MSTRLVALIAMAHAAATVPAHAASDARAPLRWSSSDVPALPDAEGFAGMYAGVSGKALIAAGGANFPDKRPWDGGAKVWYDTIWVLEHNATEWKKAGATLPRPLGYGVSVTYEGRVILIGGEDASEARAEVYALTYADAKVVIEDLPPLPTPLVQMCGTRIGSTVYVAGEIGSPGATEASAKFYAMDLEASRESMAWVELPTWPGPARMQAVCASAEGSFYLFGGVEMVADENGKPRRVMPYMTDAYRYTPGEDGAAGEWTKLADLPRATAAAPSPACVLGGHRIAILGGVDGSTGPIALQDHPPFKRDMLVYNTRVNGWSLLSDALPEGSVRVTAPVTRWRDGWAVVSGERLPALRSPQVWYVHEPTPSFGTLNWVVLIGYLMSMVAIGVYFSRKETSTHDFFLAGQRIPWWAAGISIFGTQLSAITFMAIPANAYATDWTKMIGGMLILAVAPIVVWFYLPFFRRLNVATAYAYLEARFNVVVRMVSSATYIAFQIARMGIVIYLPSIALSAVTGIDVYLCIAVMGVLATVYTALGGIEAVIWTDVVQVIVLLGGAGLCLAVVIAGDGGFQRFAEVASDDEKMRMFRWTTDWTKDSNSAWVMIVGFLVLGLIPYTSDQSVVQRYLTTRDEKAAARSIWLNGLLSVPAGLLFYGLGTALYVFYTTNPDLATPARIDQIVPWFVVHELPAGVAGLVIAGVFAAAMSSLDSAMNSVATAYVTDFHRRLAPATTDAQALRIAKGLTWVLGAIGTAAAMVMVLLQIKGFDFFNMVLGLVGGGLCGVFILAVFTTRTTWRGALAGAIAGIIAPVAAMAATQMSSYLYGAVGVAAAVAVGYITSIATGPDHRDLSGLTVHTRRSPAEAS